MQSGMNVSDIMTRNFISAQPEASLLECSKLMVKNKVGSLIIQSGKKVHGILTEGDIIAAIVRRKNADLGKIQARDIAAKKLITVKPEEDVMTALSKMRKSYHKRLPVVAGGEIVGIITVKDILKIHPELFSEVSFAFRIREEMEKLGRVSEIKGIRLSGEGRCEECGNFDTLYKSDGVLLCGSCME